MANHIRLAGGAPARAAAALRGTFLDARHYDLQIGPWSGDTDVDKPDGTPLLRYRPRALPAAACVAAFPALVRAAVPTDNRGAAAGGGRSRRVRADGGVSRVSRAAAVRSGVAGYFDRTPRFPYCRTTAYTRGDPVGWGEILPLVRAANGVFRAGCPARYAAQAAVARATPPEWVIPDTAFTTVTVNRNYRSACHRDAGDLADGFGVLAVLRAGEYAGGHLVFPGYRVAVDLGDRDVLLADVHEWHGNAPIDGDEGAFERVSVVMYYRAGMTHCLPPAAELERVKLRRPGDPLA